MGETEFYDKIADDSKQVLIQLISEAGHGKTSSLRTIIDYCRKKHPDIVFKIFDVCFDEETEILTNLGWKFIKGINENETVATLNKNNEIEYQNITEKIISFSTEMYYYKGKTMNFVVTKNHRFLINKRYRRQRTKKDIFKTEILTAKQLYEKGKDGNRCYIPRTGEWVGKTRDYFILPAYNNKVKIGQTVNRKEIKIPIDDWLSFFGLYLAEGCSTGKTTMGTPNTVSIDQKLDSKEKITKIEKMLSKLPFKISIYDYLSSSYKTQMRSFHINNVQLASFLKQFGKSKNKFIPRWILELPPSNLQHLYEGMMLGDGSISKFGAMYTTSSKQLADDFQELVFKLGKFANVRENSEGNWVVTISDKKESMVLKNRFTKKQETKLVYCVTVPNQTIYVRRKGQPFWSMNSQAWFHCAPTKYRQYVTRKKIENGQIENICDCVYEIGSLGDEEKRAFVGTVIGLDYQRRYKAKMDNDGKLDDFLSLVYVFEESNIYFGSYSFRKNDQYSPIFQQYVSVGRNYKMRGFLVATAEMGEMAPSLRDRSRKIYGRITSERDLAVIRRKNDDLAKYLMEIPKYTFVYLSDKPYGPVKVPDAVKSTPEDYVVKVVEKERINLGGGWWIQFLLALFMLGMFAWYIIGS